MISVPSHRPRSNGNKTGSAGILLLIILVFSLQSCGFIEDLFQGKKKKTRTEKPKEKEKVEIREIEWKDVTDAEDVIRNYPDKTQKEEDIYDVLCLLPFSGTHKDKGRALYAGMKMASKDSDPDVNLRFTTFDISRLAGEPEMLRNILSTQQFDLVVSPYSTDDVNKVVELSQGSGAVVLSPWNTSPSVQKFARYVQLNPGLQSHFSGIVDWAAREYGIGSTMIVGHKKDARLVGMIQGETSGLENYYTASNPKENITELSELISSKDVNAIIIPSWRNSDEAYFLSLLSTLNAARGARPLSVFVLSSWMNNNNINYDQFNGLNLHFTSSRYVNTESRAVRRFEDRYIDRNHYFPDEDVYYGHDVYLMVMEWISQYKNKIIDQVVNYNCRDCFFRYDFVEKISEQGQPYILNNHVDIISFKDYEYHRVN